MARVKFEVLTDDKRIQELCALYWLVDSENRYVFKVAYLAREYGIKCNKVAGVVRQHCHAYRDDFLCNKCGKPIRYVESRDDAGRAFKLLEKCRMCEDCAE